MTFKKGEKNWALRLYDQGKPRLYYADTLLEKFKEYWIWVQENPLYRSTLVQKTGKIEEVPLGRPMSIGGFCLFAGMSQNTFCYYAKNPEYHETCQLIKDAIYTNKYEGAVVGLFSAAVIIRDLGLSDSVSHVLEDKRKDVSELFPDDDEIMSISVGETSIAEIEQINSNNDFEYEQADKQELRILSATREESIEERGNTGRVLPLR